MLARPEIHRRLADGFVAVRLDWEQGHHYRERFGSIPGTGDQLVLDPDGRVIPPADGSAVYGRHGLDTTPEVLDAVTARFNSRGGPETLNLDWFWWSTRPSGNRAGGRYPASPEQIAQYARLPIASVEGPIPSPLQDTEFLRRHVRQFIWVRGSSDPGTSTITVSRVRDGHPEALPTSIATIDADGQDGESLGNALDAAWIDYMRHRPLTARGYLENPHGGWMRGQADQMLREDEEVRQHAAEGRLLPPGRSARKSPVPSDP